MQKIFSITLLLSLIILTGCSSGDGSQRADCWREFCNSQNQTYSNPGIVPDRAVCLDSNQEIHRYDITYNECREAVDYGTKN